MARPPPATDRQIPFDVAVVIPTLLRDTLDRAVESVFVQDLSGRIQILIGVDKAEGDRARLRSLSDRCPENMLVTVFDPGYSTSVRHGGVHSNTFGGALHSILSYAANSQFVAYLDDDNWWAPSHLSDLRRAIDGFDWAYSLRWFVDPISDAVICRDEWESVGPNKGVFTPVFGGFADPSTLMVDKLKCHWVLPLWAFGPMADGGGSDRLVFRELVRKHPVGWTGQATAYYTIKESDPMHPTRLAEFERRGVSLATTKSRRILARTEPVRRPTPRPNIG